MRMITIGFFSHRQFICALVSVNAPPRERARAEGSALRGGRSDHRGHGTGNWRIEPSGHIFRIEGASSRPRCPPLARL